MKKLLALAIILTISFASKATDSTFLTLQVGGSIKNAFIGVVDQVTGAQLSATITNVSVQNNNPELATVVVNPLISNGIKATAVAAGTGTAVVSCNVSYVDPGDGQTKTENKTIIISYTVIGAPHGVKLSLTFN
jgi:hypothetical protein